MEDCVRPNIAVPVSLWGEVKVSAFRRGIKPCEIVLECLRERFSGVDERSGEPIGSKVKSKTASPAQMVVEVPKPYDTVQSALSRPTPEPVSEFLCKICGKPTNGEY